MSVDNRKYPLSASAEELAAIVRQMFAHFVDTPLQTERGQMLAASTIAAIVCDTHSPALHLAYNAVRSERTQNGKPLGSR